MSQVIIALVVQIQPAQVQFLLLAAHVQLVASAFRVQQHLSSVQLERTLLQHSNQTALIVLLDYTARPEVVQRQFVPKVNSKIAYSEELDLTSGQSVC